MSEMLPQMGAAFDARSLDALKRVAKQDPQNGLKMAAKQMEGLFVQMMLKSMRDATPQGGLFASPQSKMYTSMLDQQLAQNMAAEGKSGLAESILKSLGGEMKPEPNAQNALQDPLKHALERQYFARQPAEPFLTVNRYLPEVAQQQDRSSHPTGPISNNASFISRLSGPAKAVAGKSGIPHHLILAQAALESGWGNREIVTQKGQPSFNLFGIKASDDWKGETTEITTTEYINGVRQKVKAAFRVYHSYAEGLADYANLLTRNPRYQKVVGATTAEKGAHALQAGGYATDPEYANKLISIIDNIRHQVNKTSVNYKADLSSFF